MLRKATLTREQKAYFKRLLSQSLEELANEAGGTAASRDELDDQGRDPIDQASLETDRILSFRIRERDGWLAQKIKTALKKLEDGTFGICEECGTSIPEKRLRARPIAVLCIECKEKQENDERMREAESDHI